LGHWNFYGFVKSPSAALRFTLVVAAYLVSTPHSLGFARLAYGVFYIAIGLVTFHEIINLAGLNLIWNWVLGIWILAAGSA
jgi:hypothetical protein